MSEFKLFLALVGFALVTMLTGVLVFFAWPYLPFVALFLVAAFCVAVIVGLAGGTTWLALHLHGKWRANQVIHRGDVVAYHYQHNLIHLSAIHESAKIRTVHMPATVQAVEADEQEQEVAIPSAPSWAAIQHAIQPGHLLLGYAAHGAIFGAIDDLLSTAIVGRPGTGKSSMLRLVCAQLLKIGGMPCVFDPHGSIADEVGNELLVAENEKQMCSYSRWLIQELDARLEARRAGRRDAPPPLLLLVDEFPIVSQMHDIIGEAIRRIVLEGRKARLFTLIAGQGLPANLFGGSLVRDALSSRYIFNTSPAQARLAGLEQDVAKRFLALLAHAGSGRAILATARYEPELVAVPYVDATDIQALLPSPGSSSRCSSTVESSVTQPDKPFPSVPAQEAVGGMPHVSTQERERILELYRQGVPRRDMCRRLGKGSGYYRVVKQVLDEEAR